MKQARHNLIPTIQKYLILLQVSLTALCGLNIDGFTFFCTLTGPHMRLPRNNITNLKIGDLLISLLLWKNALFQLLVKFLEDSLNIIIYSREDQFKTTDLTLLGTEHVKCKENGGSCPQQLTLEIYNSWQCMKCLGRWRRKENPRNDMRKNVFR